MKLLVLLVDWQEKKEKTDKVRRKDTRLRGRTVVLWSVYLQSNESEEGELG